MRLFTALDLPEVIVDQLEQLIARLKPAARIHWSQPANLHITTKFIGEWPEERLDELKAALAAIPSRAAINAHIRGVGFFRGEVTPHSFWCGVDAPELPALAGDTDVVTAALGIKTEKRPFRPHLTLARIKQPLSLAPLRAAMEREKPMDFGQFEAPSFYLYRSQLKPTGSVYTKLAEFPLTHT